MVIRPIRQQDLQQLSSLLGTIENFSRDEVACALELLELAQSVSPEEHPDYRVLVAGAEPLTGYVCFGPTPMTAATWDLYWIASSPAARGTGVGTELLLAMEGYALARGGRQVRIETSSLDDYEATRRFYVRHSYLEASRLRDFYKPGDDLVTLYKRLEPPADSAA